MPLKYFFVLVVLLLSVFLVFEVIRIAQTGLRANYKPVEGVYFMAKNAEGYAPHTAAIHYDISKLTGKNIRVDMGGREGMPVRLNAEENILTHTFSVPGYYKIQLYNDNQLVGMDNVTVYSKQWESYIIINNQMHALTKNSESQNGVFAIPQSLGHFSEIDTTKAYFTHFVLVEPIPASLDSMVFSTRIMLLPSNSIRGCQYLVLSLLGEKEELRLTLTNPACTKKAEIDFSDYYEMTGRIKEHPLVLHANSWHTITIETQNKNTSIRLDGKEVKRFTYQFATGKMMAIEMTALGNMKMDDVIVNSPDGNTIYKADFNQ